MIKFFRKIRQNLISENPPGQLSRAGQMGKYMKYAIGEILLVMIGILLALQVNTWNEERKASQEERILLLNLKEEFTKNLNELQSDHDINLIMLESSYYFLETDLGSLTNQQIDSLVGEMSTFATFDPSTGYIEQAISSNKLDLIQSDTLKRYLSQWTGELNDLNEDNIIRREHWLNHFLPMVRRYIPIRNSDVSQDRPDYLRERKVTFKQFPEEDHQGFISSMEVDGVVFDHYMNQSYVVINEDGIKDYIQRVMGLIKDELNKEL